MTINMEPDVAAVAVPSDAELARSLDGDFRSDYVTVAGLRLHYVAGGTGRPLLLLHGWPETWWEFRKVMPALAAGGRRVIAVDLPGTGGSDKPATGYDKKTLAGVIHGLVRALGYDQVDIAGHDIGSQVAFSFAVNYPEAARKIAMLDILHANPTFYEIPMLPIPGVPVFPWWVALNQVVDLPEQLLPGRFGYLIDWLFDNYLVDKSSVTPLDRAIYTNAYDNADSIRGSNAWYGTFGHDIVDLETYGKVTAPVLGIVSNLGDGLYAKQMQAMLPNQATDVEVVVLPDAGHYIVDEEPQAIINEFNKFFD